VIETIPPALDGERVDRVVALVLGTTRTQAVLLIDEGRVLLDGRPVTQRSRRVRAGEQIELPEVQLGPVLPEPDASVPFRVVHEDDDVIVIDKPAGVVVHPGAGNPSGTLVNGLLARFPELAEVGDPARPGIVHRLDKGTSGLLVVARTEASYEDLVEQLSSREVHRGYRALAWGEFASPAGVIDAPIGRSDRDPTKMVVSLAGREARTHYEVDHTYHDPVTVSLLTCELETGRTHQIRVHLAAIGHPVVGDARYRGVRPGLHMARPFLHAASLRFVHPGTGDEAGFTSPLPDDLVAVLDSLR
jgi:23S rRNA pseudouridine1911/1915/1917 synthase